MAMRGIAEFTSTTTTTTTTAITPTNTETKANEIVAAQAAQVSAMQEAHWQAIFANDTHEETQRQSNRPNDTPTEPQLSTTPPVPDTPRANQQQQQYAQNNLNTSSLSNPNPPYYLTHTLHSIYTTQLIHTTILICLIHPLNHTHTLTGQNQHKSPLTWTPQLLCLTILYPHMIMTPPRPNIHYLSP